MSTIKFNHREPIGSSTFPMPNQKLENSIDFVEAIRSEFAPKLRTSIYIHIPFCDQICSFCGFNKYISSESVKKKYVDALLLEMKLYGQVKNLINYPINSVYIGGGTPNSLQASDLSRILSALRDNFSLDHDCEITCEGIPQNFNDERIEALLAGKVTRLSTGIQTFNQEIRKNHLSMTDGKEDLIKHIEHLAKWFPNYNLDLIYNLPGQTPEIWYDDLKTALELNSPHLTVYPLVLLESTLFYKEYVRQNKYLPPNEDVEIDLFNYSLAELKKSHLLDQYTVRDWAIKSDFRCRYIQNNAKSNYVLALGAGSHGYLGDVTYRNIQTVTRYSEMVKAGQFPVDGIKILSLDERIQRFFVMGLRLTSLNLSDFARIFDNEVPEYILEKLQDMIDGGYISIKNNIVLFTELGRIWANNVRTYFENGGGNAVGYTDTSAIGETGKDHYSSITRIKASADIEAN